MDTESPPLLANQTSGGFAVHPFLVHFPIAFLLAGSAALLLNLSLQWGVVRAARNGLESKREPYPALDNFGVGALVLGYAGLVFTIGTGLVDLLGSPKSIVRDGWVVIAIIHLSAAFSLLVLYGLLLYRRFFGYADPDPAIAHPKFDWLSVVIIMLGIALVVVTGWFGGELVYSYRVGIS